VQGSQLLPIIYFTLCSFVFGVTSELCAQPKSYLYIQSSDEVIKDLNHLVEKLAGNSKEWKDKIEPNILTFLEGMETNQPLLFEMQLDLEATKYINSFPVKAANQKVFLKNLDGLGIKSKPAPGGMYQLRSAFEGFLVFKDNYAHISSDKNDLTPALLHQVPVLAKKPIDNQVDFSYWINNEKDKLPERSESFARFSKKVLENIVDRPKLTKEENVLAKLGIKQQLEELQRYFVESKIVDVEWTTSITPKSEGLGTLLFQPLEGTSLEESLKLITTPEVSQFQKVTSTPNSTVSFRTYFPLDAFRKQQLVDFLFCVSSRFQTTHGHREVF
jgi:hypothetical protein